MKGMVGICLYPGRALLETKVRLYNRTPFSQSFLWWENAAVHINDQYQVFFPPDVHYAVFHTKEFVVSYPVAKGPYSGGSDFDVGVDISWYKNLEAATSFFAAPSKYAFFGGYDHRQEAGVVHIANPFISPGKKFFTWGNGAFGRQWQKNLADDDSPYLELMAGVYTDNQPDFSWIQPFETRVFSQYWYPVQKTGSVKNANQLAAVNLDICDSNARIAVLATEVFIRARISLIAGDMILVDEYINLAPGNPFIKDVALPEKVDRSKLLLQVLRSDGVELIRYVSETTAFVELPEPYQPPPHPEETATVEELYLIGLHLEQYRHPEISPLTYWQEGLRRDPGDSRCNNALGLVELRRGNYKPAEAYFKQAIKRLTCQNQNPYDGEPFYNLGLSLFYQNRLDEAYAAFYKAVWNHAWQAPAYFALAQIDCRRKDFQTALEHLDRSFQTNRLNSKASNLKSAVLRYLDHPNQARRLSSHTLSLDPLDHWARYEFALATPADLPEDYADQIRRLSGYLRGDVQTILDIALDYAAAGLWNEASKFLQEFAVRPNGSAAHYPMVYYALGFFASQAGEAAQMEQYFRQAARLGPDFCFPFRLEEIPMLKTALSCNPSDARAHYYLGNLYYDKKAIDRGVEHWEMSNRIDPTFAMPLRNLGLSAYNIHQDIDKALSYYRQAFALSPDDDRMLYELDQLEKRNNVQPIERLHNLENNRGLVERRDDLTIELVALYNRLGQYQNALDILQNRQFHPWEGGEGMVSGQYLASHWLLGRQELEAHHYQKALEHFEAASYFPSNLGETGYLELTHKTRYYIGVVKASAGELEEAQQIFREIATASGHFPSSKYYQALALEKLGEHTNSQQLLKELLAHANQGIAEEIRVNFFYVTMPSPVFMDDLTKIRKVDCLYWSGLASLGLNSITEARSFFKQTLALDINHLEAYEELRRLEDTRPSIND
jgi:tetratricopeptide (TPR) repeat protein